MAGELGAEKRQKGPPLTCMKCSFSSLSMMTGNKTERDQGEAGGTCKTLPKTPFHSQIRGSEIPSPSPAVPEKALHLGEAWKTRHGHSNLAPESQQKGLPEAHMQLQYRYPRPTVSFSKLKTTLEGLWKQTVTLF